LVHFDPLSSTFNHFAYQDVNKKLKPHFAATLPTRKPRLRRELGPGLCKIDNRLRLQPFRCADRLQPDCGQNREIVYSYVSAGQQTGYSIFDASGKLIGRTSAPLSSASVSPKGRK
jgi:hypothetical protein